MIEEKRKKLGEETVSSRINKKNWTKSKSRGKKNIETWTEKLCAFEMKISMHKRQYIYCNNNNSTKKENAKNQQMWNRNEKNRL